ncbi:SorU family sulfite dehydrogenase c-type cytochrome subunit [Noviherbaspirillum sp.]|uniref:SorU family sulfite dehydrogenase c-type cytochrome subunit n=1 Tax=Noviherbaspirillum sp. TaxID=1926288 RepID=UPI002FE309AB
MHRLTKALSVIPILVAAFLGGTAFAQSGLDEGKKLFTQVAAPACSVCHTLRHAGATGEVGPNLDELKPDASQVEKAVRNGIGQMPAFKGLSDAEIAALSKYVAAVAGTAK